MKSRAVLTQSVSSGGPSASVAVSVLSSLGLPVFATEPLVSHTQIPSVALDTPRMVEARLSGMGTVVAQTELSPWLAVPTATATVVPGVCLPSADALVLLVPGGRATLSHPVPCLSTVWVVPEVCLLAAGDAVSEDLMMRSPVARLAKGLVLEGSVNGRGRAHGKATLVACRI